MSDLFLERSFEPGLHAADVVSMAQDTGWCFEIYKVDWHGSLLSADGQRMLCWFSAADAEAVRQALQRAGAECAKLWPGTVHDAPEPGEANVLVERSFAEPVTLDAIQALEDQNQWCLDTHKVKFVRTFFASDRKRMICLYAGPDAEAVRVAQAQAGMPMDRVWGFERIGAEDAAA